MSAGAVMRDLRLHPAGTPAVTRPTDLGRLLTGAEVAIDICQGKRSARWVNERMGPTIGKKPGREWYFYEAEARAWWAKYLEGRTAR